MVMLTGGPPLEVILLEDHISVATLKYAVVLCKLTEMAAWKD